MKTVEFIYCSVNWNKNRIIIFGKWLGTNWSVLGLGKIYDERDVITSKSLNTCAFICCSIEFQVKKEGWGGGGTRAVKFTLGSGEIRQTKVSGKQMVVSIGQGLPENSSQYLIQSVIESSQTVSEYHLLQYIYFLKLIAGNSTNFLHWHYLLSYCIMMHCHHTTIFIIF